MRCILSYYEEGMQQQRQESHRVYLQRFTDSLPSNEVGRQQSQSQNLVVEHDFPPITTTSVAIRFTSSATCQDIVHLLRQKFNLNTKLFDEGRENESGGQSAGKSSPLLHRIHAHLEQVRGSKSVPKTESGERSIKKTPLNKNNDHLVIVVTCSYLPRGYIRFEHEKIEEDIEASERDVLSDEDSKKP